MTTTTTTAPPFDLLDSLNPRWWIPSIIRSGDREDLKESVYKVESDEDFANVPSYDPNACDPLSSLGHAHIKSNVRISLTERLMNLSRHEVKKYITNELLRLPEESIRVMKMTLINEESQDVDFFDISIGVFEKKPSSHLSKSSREMNFTGFPSQVEAEIVKYTLLSGGNGGGGGGYTAIIQLFKILLSGIVDNSPMRVVNEYGLLFRSMTTCDFLNLFFFNVDGILNWSFESLRLGIIHSMWVFELFYLLYVRNCFRSFRTAFYEAMRRNWSEPKNSFTTWFQNYHLLHVKGSPFPSHLLYMTAVCIEEEDGGSFGILAQPVEWLFHSIIDPCYSFELWARIRIDPYLLSIAMKTSDDAKMYREFYGVDVMEESATWFHRYDRVGLNFSHVPLSDWMRLSSSMRYVHTSLHDARFKYGIDLSKSKKYVSQTVDTRSCLGVERQHTYFVKAYEMEKDFSKAVPKFGNSDCFFFGSDDIGTNLIVPLLTMSFFEDCSGETSVSKMFHFDFSCFSSKLASNYIPEMARNTWCPVIHPVNPHAALLGHYSSELERVPSKQGRVYPMNTMMGTCSRIYATLQSEIAGVNDPQGELTRSIIHFGDTAFSPFSAMLRPFLMPEERVKAILNGGGGGVGEDMMSQLFPGTFSFCQQFSDRILRDGAEFNCRDLMSSIFLYACSQPLVNKDLPEHHQHHDVFYDRCLAPLNLPNLSDILQKHQLAFTETVSRQWKFLEPEHYFPFKRFQSADEFHERGSGLSLQINENLFIIMRAFGNDTLQDYEQLRSMLFPSATSHAGLLPQCDGLFVSSDKERKRKSMIHEKLATPWRIFEYSKFVTVASMMCNELMPHCHFCKDHIESLNVLPKEEGNVCLTNFFTTNSGSKILQSARRVNSAIFPIHFTYEQVYDKLKKHLEGKKVGRAPPALFPFPIILDPADDDDDDEVILWSSEDLTDDEEESSGMSDVD